MYILRVGSLIRSCLHAQERIHRILLLSLDDFYRKMCIVISMAIASIALQDC